MARKFTSVNCGHLNNYQLFNDSNFLFNTNEYFGLKRIISIGGKYKYDKAKKLPFMIVQFTNEVFGGHIERSKESGSTNDSWNIEGGKIKKVLLSKPVKGFINIEFLNLDDNGNDLMLLDKKSIIKLNSDNPQSYLC
jgi:hypothetical protein